MTRVFGCVWCQVFEEPGASEEREAQSRGVRGFGSVQELKRLEYATNPVQQL